MGKTFYFKIKRSNYSWSYKRGGLTVEVSYTTNITSCIKNVVSLKRGTTGSSSR